MGDNNPSSVEAAAASPKPDALPPIAVRLLRLAGPLSIVSYLLSLPVLSAGIWLMCMRDYDCEDLLRMPGHLRVLMGAGMVVIFAASNLVVLYGARAPLPGMVAVMVPLTVAVTVGLALVGSYRMETRAVPGSPVWLRTRVRRGANWDNIKACIYDSGVCSDLAYRTVALTSYDFSIKRLSPIESGCCKPPAICGMEYVNATFWSATAGADGGGGGGGDSGETVINTDRSPSSSSSSSPPNYYFSSFGDCHAWSNDNTRLCYNCETCQLGFLATLQHRWRRLGVFITTMSVLLAIMHVVRFVANMSEIYRYII